MASFRTLSFVFLICIIGECFFIIYFYSLPGIIKLLGQCKGGNFNIISGRGSAISSAQYGRTGSINNW